MCECVCVHGHVYVGSGLSFLNLVYLDTVGTGGHKRQNKDCFQCGLLREKQGTHSLTHIRTHNVFCVHALSERRGKKIPWLRVQQGQTQEVSARC